MNRVKRMNFVDRRESPAYLAIDIIREMTSLTSEERAQKVSRFFQTQPGGYGEGDRFLGISNPLVREMVKKYSRLSWTEVQALLKSPWHEIRLCAVLILVAQFKKGDQTIRKRILTFYIDQIGKRINNWDLVDLSAPHIVGRYDLLYQSQHYQELSNSPLLWHKRVAIVSTMTLVRNNIYDPTLNLALKFKDDPHDLIKKATGWLLREVGKKNTVLLTDFLWEHRNELSRTTLRYAIERYSEKERKKFLAREGKK